MKRSHARPPSTNPIFTEVSLSVPATVPVSGGSEFDVVLRPFSGRAFATGIAASEAGIGPMAIAVRADGSVLISGGAARNQLFVVGPQGGAVGPALATLPYPIFDLAFSAQGELWAATGGGPLLQLNPTTGAIIGEFGDGITQSLAIELSSKMKTAKAG